MGDWAGVKSLESDTGLSEDTDPQGEGEVIHAYSSSCHDVLFAEYTLCPGKKRPLNMSK